jgi:hypothetical protein
MKPLVTTAYLSALQLAQVLPCCHYLYFFSLLRPFSPSASRGGGGADVHEQKVDDEIISFPNADKQKEQEASGQNTLRGAVITWTLCSQRTSRRATAKKVAYSNRPPPASSHKLEFAVFASPKAS